MTCSCKNNSNPFNGGYRRCEKPCEGSCCSENKCYKKKSCDYKNNWYHKRNGHDAHDFHNSDSECDYKFNDKLCYDSSEDESCFSHSKHHELRSKFVVWKKVRKFEDRSHNGCDIKYPAATSLTRSLGYRFY